jgi:protein SCO1/2
MAEPEHPSTPRRHRGGLIAIVLLTGALLIVAACGSDTSSRSTASTALGNEVMGIQRDQPLDVSAVTLPEVAAGVPDQPFTMKADDGKLLFVYFGYTHCPDLCPTTLADLRKALAQLGTEDAAKVQVAFVTVDPDRDTADTLGPFLASFVSGAHALRTTDAAQLRSAEDAFLASSTVTTGSDGAVEVSHTAISYLVDSLGQVVDEMPFGTTPDAMANDIRLLLAAQSTTGT